VPLSAVEGDVLGNFKLQNFGWQARLPQLILDNFNKASF
jgi:hypothetical protein